MTATKKHLLTARLGLSVDKIPFSSLRVRLVDGVYRGGSWYDSPRNVRSASRVPGNSRVRGTFLGFRCARALD
jgi:hypothetical protein